MGWVQEGFKKGSCFVKNGSFFVKNGSFLVNFWYHCDIIRYLSILLHLFLDILSGDYIHLLICYEKRWKNTKKHEKNVFFSCFCHFFSHFYHFLLVFVNFVVIFFTFLLIILNINNIQLFIYNGKGDKKRSKRGQKGVKKGSFLVKNGSFLVNFWYHCGIIRYLSILLHLFLDILSGDYIHIINMLWKRWKNTKKHEKNVFFSCFLSLF